MRQFEEGKASVYALVAKDQLISFDDLSFAACSSRENAEVEASVRSQREAAEAKTLASRERSGPELAGKVGQEAVAAAPTLADSSMDKYWREVGFRVLRDGQRGNGCAGARHKVLIVQKVFDSNTGGKTWCADTLRGGHAISMCNDVRQRDNNDLPDASATVVG